MPPTFRVIGLPINTLIQTYKGYSVTLDSKGIIRLIAYTTTRQLVYYEFLEGKWNSQVVDRIYSRYQDIPYYFILPRPWEFIFSIT